MRAVLRDMEHSILALVDKRPALARLAAVFLRIGNLTFGGGDPTMAALHRELVTKRGWLSANQYGLTYGLARATPGTNLLAFCAGAAWHIRGVPAAVLAVAAVTVPSACVVLGLTLAYQTLHNNRLAAALIAATLAAAVGMMFAAALRLIRPGLSVRRGGRLRVLRTSVLFAGACGLLVFRLLGPLQVLGLAALAGILWREPE